MFILFNLDSLNNQDIKVLCIDIANGRVSLLVKMKCIFLNIDGVLNSRIDFYELKVFSHDHYYH